MRKVHLSVFVAVLVGCLAGSSAARGQDVLPKPKTLPDAVPAPKVLADAVPAFAHLPGVIFVVDGSGGSRALTQGLTDAINRSGGGFVLHPIFWCRFNQALQDHTDEIGHLIGAQQLADKIMWLRTKQPGRKIFIMTHSAGSHAALEAAKMSPPNSIDRMILLAPSVSFCYDLGPALQATRDGIDSFYSQHDNVLDTVSTTWGTADGLRVQAAGQRGFAVSPGSPNAVLYQQKLRQHPWIAEYQCTFNQGGHLGWVRPLFLQTYVVPLMWVSEAAPMLAVPAGE